MLKTVSRQGHRRETTGSVRSTGTFRIASSRDTQPVTVSASVRDGIQRNPNHPIQPAYPVA